MRWRQPSNYNLHKCLLLVVRVLYLPAEESWRQRKFWQFDNREPANFYCDFFCQQKFETVNRCFVSVSCFIKSTRYTKIQKLTTKWIKKAEEHPELTIA
ncbi:uncharacterized protein LOC131995781 isoform X2 [Stomoxys calcitrans]|uniref:uncharacterized protein LOC131995781 isoform X2 n=1 Tax=Stomoxys calcitrans TaxID=35570 RepID=UPI0027E2D0D7|nr:uncharacterized protein LOC131995781 isoform X2 [Stomoxys calcitrans]